MFVINTVLTEGETQRSQYSQKAQECQTLRADLNRAKIKSVAPSLGVPATPPPSAGPTMQHSGLVTPPRPQSVSTASAGSRSGATSPISPTRTSYTPSFQSPLVRPPPSLHSRTTSLHVGQRSMTPSVRSGTPVVSGADIARPSTIPPKPRRMSMSSTPTPTKMSRSSSSWDEKERMRVDDKQREKDERRVQLIQRWIPSVDALSRSPPTGRPDKFESSIPISSTAAPRPQMPHILRYKTPLSNASP